MQSVILLVVPVAVTVVVDWEAYCWMVMVVLSRESM